MDAYARSILGVIHFFNREPEAAIRESRTAIEIDPNFSRGHFALGQAKIGAGKALEGIEHIKTALSFGARDPVSGPATVWMAMGYLFMGDYKNSADWAEKALSLPSTQFWGNATLAAALSYLGRTDEMIIACQELLRRKPDFDLRIRRK